ncbi:MAG: Flp pilus assembly protein CpaB [Candidatus Poriferisodalaceae bacterium]|jgi:Flp pilus assembly protein CpaB
MFASLLQPWRRRPRTQQWTVIALAALGAASLTYSAAAKADARAVEAEIAWGSTELIAAASSDLPAGHVLQSGDIRLVTVPVGLIPSRALRTVADGETLVGSITRGSLLTSVALAGRGTLPLLPVDTRGVAVAISGTTPPVSIGGRVELIIGIDPGGSLTRVDGVVTNVAEHQVLVAVPVAEAAMLATAASHGMVSLVLGP